MMHALEETAVFIQRLYYRHLRRYAGSLILTGVVPLLGIVWLLPAPISTSLQILLLVWMGLLLLAFVTFVIRHYRALQRDLSPVAALAAVGKTTAHVAHDLMGPLTSLRVALRDFGDEGSTASHTASRIKLLRMAAARLERVAQGILQATAPQRLKMKTVDIHPLLTAILQEYQLHPKMAGMRFQTDFAAEAALIRGEQEPLERALANLIKNALEAMQFQGDLTVQTQITLDTVVATISDTGPGMSAELLQAIQEGRGYSVGKAHGHGLGLQSVREVVQAHGGELSIRSVIGAGTCFVIQWPRAEADTDTHVVSLTRTR